MDFLGRNKTARFIFELENGKELKLDYYLQENSLREKWAKEVKYYQKQPGAYNDLNISNKSYHQLDELKEKINFIIKTINTVYNTEMLVPFNRTKDICRNKLNQLHEKFEEYGENSSSDDPKSWYRGKKVHGLWLQLNVLIHIIENALLTKDQTFPNYSALVTVFPPYPGKELEERDKIFLTTEFSWGNLYLGYNTLGKDYMHVCLDKDTRVITNNMVKVQSMYSSEVWLCFHEKPELLKEVETQFYKWYESLDDETKKMIPEKDLNKLSLGRYYLGHIIINQDLLKFHPIKDDWIYSKKIQKKWNEEVFSTVTNIKKIEIS